MIVKQIVDEDFVNYKKPSMLIAFPKCSWKCENECGMRVCQNGALAAAPDVDISAGEIAERYSKNPLTSAIVIGGLEPFDSYDELSELIYIIRCRYKCCDDIVIYTGYNQGEIMKELTALRKFENIIVKFGRFVPNHAPHYDGILGVMLASENQYAERIS